MIEVKYRATLETANIEYDYADDVDDKPAETQKEEVGKAPLVNLNGIQIENENIVTLKIKNKNIYPEIELEFSDPTSKLLEDEYPADNTIISIYKKATSKGLMDIKMDFKILSFQTNNGVSGDQVTFKITGILNIDDMYLYNFESYKGTTYDVLDQLSKKMKLGYVSNITSTNDEMVWINNGGLRQNFIKDIISKSYIDDSTFLIGYIDFYYNFNYVDINKQLNLDITKQVSIDDTGQIGSEFEKEPDPIPLILTNQENKSSTNLYISKYTVLNNSTQTNIDSGYRYKYTSYNTSDDKVDRYFLDSITEEGNDEKIILKGNPQVKNDKLYEESMSDAWMGKIDTDNVHEKFLQTDLQNKKNLQFLQKLKISIKMEKPNYSLYRFQKVIIELYNLAKTETKDDIDKEGQKMGESGEQDAKIIHRLSGEWLIMGINYTFSMEEGNIQEITLAKRELTSEYKFPFRDQENKNNK